MGAFPALPFEGAHRQKMNEWRAAKYFEFGFSDFRSKNLIRGFISQKNNP